MEYPQLEEFVVAKVKKILPFGAVVDLEEYGGLEAFVHISEVSPGWIRNIREHLKEGQVTVGKVIVSDASKHQVDVSVKRVSEIEKKRKLEEWQNSKRAQKLLERTLAKIGKTFKQVEPEVKALEEEFGSLYDVLDSLSKGIVPQAKASKILLTALEETAKKEIKQKQVTLRRVLKLSCFTSDGVVEIKKLLGEVSKAGGSVHYLGAPRYYVDVTSSDAKSAEKTIQKIEVLLQDKTDSGNFEWSLEKEKEK